MCENRNRTSGLASSDLVLERKPVEVEADLGSQVRALAPHLGDAVGVLHRSDEVSRFVAVDVHRLLRDARCLGGKAFYRLERVLPSSESQPVRLSTNQIARPSAPMMPSPTRN